MENELIPLSREDAFHFACGPGVPCFNACCRDLDQFLTPYDILRLKTALKIPAGDFLSRFTETHLGPRTGLPVISLKAVGEEEKLCPFVSETGCRVYEDRPSSCRLYPLARAISRSRETGVVREHFALMREAHCCGCDQPQSRSVQKWLVEQGLAPFLQFNDMLIEIIRLKNQRHPAPLDLREQRMFHLALYDLDGFRRHLRENGLPETLALTGSHRAATMDDTGLLVFAHAWLKSALFGKTAPL